MGTQDPRPNRSRFVCPSCHLRILIEDAMTDRVYEVFREEITPIIEARVTRGMEYSTATKARALVLDAKEYKVEVAEVLADTLRDLPFTTYEEVIDYTRRTIKETIETVPACTLATVDYIEAVPTRYYLTPERQAAINETWGA